MLRSTLFILIFIYPSVLSAGDESVCSELAGQYVHLDDVEVLQLSSAQEDKLMGIRTCLKNFPWPEGEFLADWNESKQVTPERMKEIRKDLRVVIEAYKKRSNFGEWIVDSLEGDSWGFSVGYALVLGRDAKLMSLFADFLVVSRLMEEERYAEVIAEVDRVFEQYRARVAREQVDELEEVTYFKEQRIYNILYVSKMNASAILGPDSAASGHEVLREFLPLRAELSWELSTLGDPTFQLFENVGCGVALAEKLHG